MDSSPGSPFDLKPTGNPVPYYPRPIRKRFGLSNADLRPAPQEEPESDISYYPHAKRHSVGARRDRQAESIESQVPPGWPKTLEGPLVWEPENLQDEKTFVYLLTPSDRHEIDAALMSFKAQELPLEQVTKSTFRLPRLGLLLTRIRNVVYNGIGFMVLRGLNVHNYEPHDRAIVFLGVSSYIAEERGRQDRRRTMIKHLMDDEKSESLADLPFHTDVTCDVAAMMTIRRSDHGGKFNVASAWTVYNELAAQSPHIIRTLAKPDWPFDTFGRHPALFRRAPLHVMDGRVIFNFSRRLLTGHPTRGRTDGVPRLTQAQADALDAVHFAAGKHHITLAMQEGDISFLNNMGLLHGRQGFHDHDKAAECKRHVMRLWLRNKEMQWTLTPPLELAWARVFDDPERPVRWDAEPVFEDGRWYGRGDRSECG